MAFLEKNSKIGLYLFMNFIIRNSVIILIFILIQECREISVGNILSTDYAL